MGDVLLGGRELPASVSAPENPPPIPPVKSWGEFVREFLRVQFDKVLIACLILFCWRIGYKDGITAGVGALLYACQSNRFRWN